MNFDGVKNVLSACKDLASAATTADAIYSTITGTTGTDLIVDAIQQLDADVKEGFKKVLNAIDDQTLIQEWKPYQTSLTTMYNQTYQYLQDLQTLQLNQGTYYVVSNTQLVPFVDWCKGGVLTTLGSYVGMANYGKLPSLAGMFTALETTNSALALWVQIVQAAQGSSLSSLAKYKNKTVFDLVVKLMSEIYTILGMIYYVHDASLKMLQSLGKGASYVSISAEIQNNFGSTSAEGTVWHKFAKELETLRTTPQTYTGSGVNPVNPQGQVLSASMTCDQYPGSDSSLGGGGTISYCTAECYANVANSFFTALQIVQLAPIGDSWPAVYLQGMLATIGPDLQLTAVTPPLSAINEPDVNGGGWVYSNNQSGYVWQPSIDLVKNINGLYPVPPSPPESTSNNVFSVVTGFAFCQVGSGMGIALQFGELDISDPSNPTVTVTDSTFVQPGVPAGNAGYFTTPGTTDLRPAGAYELDNNGNPVNQLGIMTNASLIQTDNNGRIGLNVQMAAPLYKVDFFQPSNLPQLIKTAPN